MPMPMRFLGETRLKTVTIVLLMFVVSGCGRVVDESASTAATETVGPAAAAAAAAGGSSGCRGVGTLIDSYAATNSNNAVGDGAVYFTSTLSGYMNKVGMLIGSGASSTGILYIRSRTGNNPNNDTVLNSPGQTITIPAYSGSIVEYTLTTPVAVTSGSTYWIHIYTTGNFNLYYRNANLKTGADLYLDFVGITGWDAPFTAYGCQ
jgi:hypothetical protein